MQSGDNIMYLRQATTADVPQLCALLAILFAQEADFKINAAKQTRGLRLIIEQPEVGRIFCAVAEDQIVGMVSILFTVSTADGGRKALLEDLIVLPAHRGRGLGKRLLHEAISQARAAGCLSITVLTDSTNSRAQQLYRNAGFYGSQMVPFRLSL